MQDFFVILQEYLYSKYTLKYRFLLLAVDIVNKCRTGTEGSFATKILFKFSKMKIITWLLYIVIVLVLDQLSLAAEQQQECEVGEDGTCLSSSSSSSSSSTESSSTTTATVQATTHETTTETTTTATNDVDESTTNEIDKNCPDRGHIIRCTGAHLDLNKNGKLDRVELDSAIQSLPWYVFTYLESRATP
jgi:hypothetical protein